MLYGLEALVLSETEVEVVDASHRKTLRYILRLPPSTAIPALYLLLGTLPIQAQIDIRTLGLFRDVLAADSSSPPAVYMQNLIKRQLAMKDPENSSWAMYVVKKLQMYSLPTALDITQNPPKKKRWKKLVKAAVHAYWTHQLHTEAKGKTTLELLNIHACNTVDIHPAWKDLYCPLSIHKATAKVKLLVQRYPLSTSHTAGHMKSDTCPLCRKEPETVTHFLLHCDTLAEARRPYIHRVLETCRRLGVSVDPETIVKIILDYNHLPEADSEHEVTTRNMIFKLHSMRAVVLGGVSGYKLAITKH
jgi:hypothetical protein